MAEKPQADWKRVWIRRAVYLAMAMATFFGLPLVLAVVADATGVIHFREIYGPLVWFNELSGPSFLVAFFVIVLVVSFSLYFILKLFDTSEGAW